MRQTSNRLSLAALTGAVALALPVGMALSNAPSTAPERASAEITQSYAAAGRPMDDLGVDIRYGDLSVFDAITEIGAAQSENVPYCDHRAKLLATLAHDFSETPRVKAPVDNYRSVELWASEVMGTWTAVYTRADGVGCVVSSGIGWAPGNDPIAQLQSEGLLPAQGMPPLG